MPQSRLTQAQLRKLLIGELSWKRLGRSLLFIYAFFALYVFFRADSMIFLPHSNRYSDTSDILKVRVTEREQISALALTKATAAYTLLYIHGNAEDLGDVRPVLQRLHSWGFNVFAYDYRGYGTSSGTPSEQNAYQDADAAYTYLTQRLRVPPKRIIVYGRSVGGGSAVELARRHLIAGLVLESSFTSAFRVVVPFPLLPFDKFPNLDKLRTIHCPVLVMHGQADSTIPFHHGKTLYEAAPGPKLSLWVEGAGHDDFTWVAGEQHRAALKAFQQIIEQRK